MSEQEQHLAACEAASLLLSKKASLQVWHIPDWMGDCHENTDEADDFAPHSIFDSKIEQMMALLTSQKNVKEPKLTKEHILQFFKPVPKEDLYDPNEYNPENFPWYKTDDPNVDSKSSVLPRLLEPLRQSDQGRQRAQPVLWIKIKSVSI